MYSIAYQWQKKKKKKSQPKYFENSTGAGKLADFHSAKNQTEPLIWSLSARAPNVQESSGKRWGSIMKCKCDMQFCSQWQRRRTFAGNNVFESGIECLFRWWITTGKNQQRQTIFIRNISGGCAWNNVIWVRYWIPLWMVDHCIRKSTNSVRQFSSEISREAVQGTMSLSQVLKTSLNGGSLHEKINKQCQTIFIRNISGGCAGNNVFESGIEYLFEWWITPWENQQTVSHNFHQIRNVSAGCAIVLHKWSNMMQESQNNKGHCVQSPLPQERKEQGQNYWKMTHG